MSAYIITCCHSYNFFVKVDLTSAFCVDLILPVGYVMLLSNDYVSKLHEKSKNVFFTVPVNCNEIA